MGKMKLVSAILFVSLAILLNAGCQSLPNIQDPLDGYAQLEIEKDDTNPRDWSVVIYMVPYDTFGDAILSGVSSGGGTAIQTSEEDGTYILTAGHVCQPSIQVFGGLVPFQVWVYDMAGEEAMAQIVDTNLDTDLCLLHTPMIWPGALSRIVYTGTLPDFAALQNFGHPNSWFEGSDSMTSWQPNDFFLLFKNDGYFAGLFSETIFSYTIPSVQGQSGSAILYGDALVGVISRGDMTAEHVGFAVRSEVVDQFLSRNGIFLVVQ